MFKNGHYDADQVRFYESNSKNKIGEFCPARQSVHFKKITGTLKLIFNFWKICKYSYLSFSSKKNRQKENSKLIILILQVNKEKIMCLSPQSHTQSIVNSERKQFILLEN